MSARSSTITKPLRCASSSRRKTNQKAVKKNKEFLSAGGVMECVPQWPGIKYPKNINSNEMTHAHWVAAWWSRAISQVAGQGSTEKQTLSVEQLLVQFLNMNKVAVEQGVRTPWEPKVYFNFLYRFFSRPFNQREAHKRGLRTGGAHMH